MTTENGLGLTDPSFLGFPFRVDRDGPSTVGRQQHVRELIEQVLFTNPMERVFRPEFGAGVRTLVFEPNSHSTWQMTQKRLISSLAEALAGEVDPKTLDVDVAGSEVHMILTISYKLAAIDRMERYTIRLDGDTFG